MKDFRACLLDLDGVIYRGDQLLPGARDFVHWLDVTGRQVLFVSNNSLATPIEVAEKLAHLGVPSPEGRVITAGHAAARVLASRFPGGRIYVLGTPAIERMVEEVGLHPVWRERPDGDIPEAVLVGIDRTLTYDRLSRAVHALLSGAAFFAINRDPLIPAQHGFVPGAGSLVAALESATGRQAENIGKPAPDILLQAMRQLSVTPDQTLMVGDGLDPDVVAGRAAGVTTALVLTGLTTLEQALAAIDDRSPDLIFPDLEMLLEEVRSATEGEDRA